MTSVSGAGVLIVEDEAAQRELLSYNLRKEGFRVFAAEDGEEGMLLADEEEPDLVILDWMLPQASGIEVCRRLKRGPRTGRIPIIMLTARGEEEDRVRGLDTGADDYVTKPYSVSVLLARVRALLRRTRLGADDEVMTYGDITLDVEKHKVLRAGKPHRLGPTEYRLLAALIERPGRVWSRERLLDRVWGRDSEIDFRTVDVHVGRLRKALHRQDGPNPIRTVRGVGYSLDYDV